MIIITVEHLPHNMVNSLQPLTSLVVIPNVTRGRARMQKMVIPSPTRGKNSETDDHIRLDVVTLSCGESALNCPFVQLATLYVCPVTKI